MPKRRRLGFDGVEAIMADVDRLLDGHITVGRWTLGEICDHLARSTALSMDHGTANASATREQAVYRRLFFRRIDFPEGQTPPLAIQLPTPNANLIDSVGSLRSALARLQTHNGLFAAHPMLGPLTRDEWLLFHARHAAHHLSFAIPA